MTPAVFRNQLKKILPGYSWTVHRDSHNGYLEATGKQTSGMNRTSTIIVHRNGNDGSFGASYAGFGLRAECLAQSLREPTLAQALRELQDKLERRAQKYGAAASAMKAARTAP